jgi:hypothetical protein
MKNISVARDSENFSTIIRTQRRLDGNGHSFSFHLLSEQHKNEWSDILCLNHLVNINLSISE